MSEYIYIFRGPGPSGSPEQMQQQMQKWADWAKDLGAKGNLRGGDPLERGGKIVTGPDKTVTDGPYTESKDLVGGYMLIEAADLDAAVELSKDCPIFGHGGLVEIRAVLKMSA